MIVETLMDENAALRAALAEARREIERLSAELADARGWLREHAKWACGHISEGTGGEPEACRICAVQDSEAEARRALADAIFVAEWAMAKLDRGDGVLEYTGTIEEGSEAKRRFDQALAAAPPAEPRGARP